VRRGARRDVGSRTRAWALLHERRARALTAMKPQDVSEFYRRLRERDPAPKTELKYVNAYTLLVAVVLSAQATDAGVNRATGPLFAKIDSPAKMVALGEVGLKDYIKTIGLFNSKAKNVIALSQMLVAEHGGEVPQDLEQLVKLPGVGRKTANVVLGTYFGLPTGVVVDTHVSRLSQRLGLTRETQPEKIEDDLMKLLPQDEWIMFSHRMIHHGRRVCQARKPNCEGCAMSEFCPRIGVEPPAVRKSSSQESRR